MGTHSHEDPPTQPHSIRKLVRRFADTATTPDPGLAEKIGSIVTDRRTVLAVGVTVAGFELLTHSGLVDWLQLLIHHPNGDVISGGKELLDIINNQPSQKDLRKNIVNRGMKINLERERQKVIANTHGEKTKLRVRVLGVGDSNFYKFGLMNDGKNGHPPDPQNQPHSFIQVGKDAIEPYLDDIGIASWETYTYAVPGAPSGDGYPQEERKYGLLGPEQFYNPDFQKQLRGKEGEEDVLNIVTISATGDDWRLLMQNALALAHFFSKLENIEHATKADIEQFKEILATSNSIADKYGAHITECLTQIALINEERKAKGLLENKVVIAHPFSMLETKHVPFSTLVGDNDKVNDLKKTLVKVNDDPNDSRYYLDITQIPYGNKIAYLLTVSIYQHLAQCMGTISTTHPDLAIPLEWMGLEEISDFFYKDGHPGEKGTPMQAGLFLNLFEALSARLGDTAGLGIIASISPEIAQVIKTVTTAT